MLARLLEYVLLMLAVAAGVFFGLLTWFFFLYTLRSISVVG